MKTYGVILAGGRSSRFDGEDKSWITWQDQPLIQHTITRIHPQVDVILISANRHIERYQTLGFSVIADAVPDYQGPLMGIYSVMDYLSKQHANEIKNIQLLIAPCDMPLLPLDLRQQLEQPQQPGKIHVVFENQRLQCLLALIPLSFIQNLGEFINNGKHKVEDWIRTTNPVIVDLSRQAASFRNINSHADLELLR